MTKHQDPKPPADPSGKTIQFPKPVVPRDLKDWLKQETLPIFSERKESKPRLRPHQKINGKKKGISSHGIF